MSIFDIDNITDESIIDYIIKKYKAKKIKNTYRIETEYVDYYAHGSITIFTYIPDLNKIVVYFNDKKYPLDPGQYYNYKFICKEYEVLSKSDIDTIICHYNNKHIKNIHRECDYYNKPRMNVDVIYR